MMRSILTLLFATAAVIAGSNVYAISDIGPGPGPRGGGWQAETKVAPEPGPGPRGGDWQTTILGDKPGWHPLPPRVTEDADLICDCADLFKGTKG